MITGEQLRCGSSGDSPRVEDAPLLAGQGKFTDDIELPGQAHAVFVRSPVGHAEIQHIEIAAAQKLPGVLTILTASDLATDGIGTIPPLVVMPGRGGKPMTQTEIIRRPKTKPQIERPKLYKVILLNDDFTPRR